MCANIVFDLEDFAVAEDVQKGLRYGGNEFHTLGLEEGLLAIFQQSIDQALNRSSVRLLAGHEQRQTA
jgi:hypothetical protein